MNKTRTYLVGLLALALTQSVFAALSAATLNGYLLFSPDNHEATAMKREEVSPQTYVDKIGNLAKLVIDAGADFVGLQEIGSDLEAKDLATALTTSTGTQWRPLFAQGKDTYTGEDVAAVVRMRPGVRVVSYSRVAGLEKPISKHLVVTIEADRTRYQVCVVHLIRPIRAEAIEKHERQLEALRAWAKATDANTVAVVLGDFNDTNRNLLPLSAANALVGWQPTHLSQKAFDHIYSSVPATKARVLRPPYGARPNNLLTTLWTDHFLLAADIP